MSKNKKSEKIKDVGERGFLKRLLPRLQSISPRRFIVPPGDDAAVLAQVGKPVLSIDGLTEGTHFLTRWKTRTAKAGVPLGRGLGWKLLGRSLSDLAAMGDVRDRWALIYAGVPASTPVSFLEDFFEGLREKAKENETVLVGGDTGRADRITLVAAVGGTLQGKPLERSGARAGQKLCLIGSLGQANTGLEVLMGKRKLSSVVEENFFIRQFFDHRPLFAAARILAQTRGVTSLIDTSDSLLDSIELLVEASNVGARVLLENVGLYSRFTGVSRTPREMLSSAEDHSLLFTVNGAGLTRLQESVPVMTLGTIHKEKTLGFFLNGKKTLPPTVFKHF